MGDNLRSRGFDFLDWYVMCRYCGETSSFIATLWESSLVVVFVSRSFGVSGSYQSRYMLFFLVGGIGWGSIPQTSGI